MSSFEIGDIFEKSIEETLNKYFGNNFFIINCSKKPHSMDLQMENPEISIFFELKNK